MAQSTPDKALKIKSLLASYYAEDNADGEAGSTPGRPFPQSPARSVAESQAISTVASPPLSRFTPRPLNDAVDTSYFDAETHLRRVIKETRLPALVDQHRRLAADISSLDSDMQTLVYENYSKFIEATDIIRTMDHAMEGLDGQLRRLDGLIGGVVARSEAVSGRLEERQAAIDDLTRSRTLLEQLQALLDVPRRLQAALEREALDVAAEIYADASPAFAALGHRKALHAAAAETERCRQEAVSRLRRKMAAEPSSAMETVAMIAKLGEPTDSLQDDFLGCQHKRLKGILEDAEKAVNEAQIGSWSTNDVLAVLEDLNATFLPELQRTAILYAELFNASSRHRLLVEARELFLSYSVVVRDLLAAATSAAASSRSKQENVAVDFYEGELPRGGSGLLSQHQQQHPENMGLSSLVKALQALPADISQLESALPELGTRDKASELVSNAVRNHVTACFAGLEADVGTCARAMLSAVAATVMGGGGDQHTGRSALRRGFSDMSSAAVEGLTSAVHAACIWQPQEWILEGWKDIFATMVQAQAANWLQLLPQNCLRLVNLLESVGSKVGNTPTPAMADNTNNSVLQSDNENSLYATWQPIEGSAPASPLGFLALSGFCSLTQHVLAKQLSELLTSRGMYGAQAVMEASASAAGSAASQLLTVYVQRTSEMLSESIAAKVHSKVDWSRHPPPKGPTAVCSMIAQALNDNEATLLSVEQEFSQRLAGTTHSRADSVRDHHRHPSVSSLSLDSSLAGGNVERSSMLAWSARADVSASILRPVLQTHAKTLRGCVLNRPAFQQVQLDCHYLQMVLQRALDGAEGGSEVMAALDEALVVAAERCKEGPTLLEPAVLDRMIKQ